MIYVKAANKTLSVVYDPTMTASQLIDKIKQEHSVEIRGSWSLQDSHSRGRTLDPGEILIDGRYYWLNAWFFAHTAKP